MINREMSIMLTEMSKYNDMSSRHRTNPPQFSPFISARAAYQRYVCTNKTRYVIGSCYNMTLPWSVAPFVEAARGNLPPICHQLHNSCIICLCSSLCRQYEVSCIPKRAFSSARSAARSAQVAVALSAAQLSCPFYRAVPM